MSSLSSTPSERSSASTSSAQSRRRCRPCSIRHRAEVVERARHVRDVVCLAEQRRGSARTARGDLELTLGEGDVAAVVPGERDQPRLAERLGCGDAFVQGRGRRVELAQAVQDRAEIAQRANDARSSSPSSR